MPKRKPCVEPGCERPKYAPRHRCYWHWLLSEPIDNQVRHSGLRLKKASSRPGFEPRTRVNDSEWPQGERWCSGCQYFVPLFYCSGSRCRSCASRASHGQRLRREYGITPEDYDEMFKLQKGRCYICQRTARKRRLAVDHDHVTGEVRGLLCSDSERGCNHAILGNIKDVEMARRIVDYLESPPMGRILAARASREGLVGASSVAQEVIGGAGWTDDPGWQF